MKAHSTALPGVLLLEPRVFADPRGAFHESWNRRQFAAIGIDVDFVQDNRSSSQPDVIRGLHYQVRQPQGKLVAVAAGEIFDVAVDLRRSSPTFGRWVGYTLSAANRAMLWIPAGFAHGFCVTSSTPAEVLYKASDYWAPEHERCIAFDDPQLAIPWPLGGPAILSDKDRAGVRLADAETYP